MTNSAIIDFFLNTSGSSTADILLKILLGLGVLAVVVFAAVLIASLVAIAVAIAISILSIIPNTIISRKLPRFREIPNMIFQNAFMMIKEIVSQKFVSVIVFFAIIIAVFSVGIFQILGDNFNTYVSKKFASAIPPNTIKVQPKPMPTFGFLKLRQPPGSKLNDKYLERIVRYKGVKKIHPYMAAQLPMQAVIPIFGLRYRTDLVCIGAPYSMVGRDIPKKYRKKWRSWKPKKEIPVLIPTMLLNTYNDSMAEANNLPRIKPAMVLETRFDMLFGRNGIKTIPGFVVEKGVLVGFTEGVSTLAVVVPLKVARHYNKKFNPKKMTHKEYVYCYVEVRSHEALAPVARRIKRMGFIVETEKSLSKEILALKQNVNILIQSLTVIILILAIIAIAFSTTIATLNRMEYYRVMRILGASKLFITLTILLKYTLFGFIGAKFSLELINLLSSSIANSIKMAGFKLSIILTKDFSAKFLFWGTIVPALSTVPALAKLYIKGLNRD